jgi:hypothetical protein
LQRIFKNEAAANRGKTDWHVWTYSFEIRKNNAPSGYLFSPVIHGLFLKNNPTACSSSTVPDAMPAAGLTFAVLPDFLLQGNVNHD